jgi:hypothetical protein
MSNEMIKRKTPEEQELTLTDSHSLAVKKADMVKRGLELISKVKKQTLNVLIGDLTDNYISFFSYIILESIPKDKYELNLIGAFYSEEIIGHSLKGDIDIFILIINNIFFSDDIFKTLLEIKQTYPRPIISLSGNYFLKDPSIINGAILGSDYFLTLPFSDSDFMKSFEMCLAMLPYYKGDFRRAFVELLPFAQNSDAKAQFILGSLYAKGQGVYQDSDEAIKWFRKAAEQGHAKAQHNLGGMYYDGLGVSKNYITAYMWYCLAASQGHNDSAKALDNIIEKMTPAQIAEADKMVSEWKTKRSEEN